MAHGPWQKKMSQTTKRDTKVNKRWYKNNGAELAYNNDSFVVCGWYTHLFLRLPTWLCGSETRVMLSYAAFNEYSNLVKIHSTNQRGTLRRAHLFL